MTNQQPPELFSSRPVRSDFGRKGPKRKISLRLIVALGTLVLLGGGVLYSVFSDKEEMLPQGEAPVIEPMGETKVRPEDRGGLDVPHQDVLVFEELEEGAKKNQERVVEHLLPPPETPELDTAVEVETETQPFPSAKTVRADAQKDETLPPPPADGQPVIRTEKLIEDSKPVYKIVEKKAEEPAKVKAKAEPKDKAEEKPIKTFVISKAEESSPITTKKIEKAKPAVEAKKEEAPRLPKELFTTGKVPEKKKEEVKIAAVKKTTAAKKVEKKAVSVKATRRLQLASFKDEAAAKMGISKFKKKYSAILKNVSLKTVRADLGKKGIYYRVMSTYMTEAEAKSVCSKLKAKKAGCLVAK